MPISAKILCNKSEMAVKFGEKQVLVWRRSYDTPPPALKPTDDMWPGRDPRYADLAVQIQRLRKREHPGERRLPNAKAISQRAQKK